MVCFLIKKCSFSTKDKPVLFCEYEFIHFEMSYLVWIYYKAFSPTLENKDSDFWGGEFDVLLVGDMAPEVTTHDYVPYSSWKDVYKFSEIYKEFGICTSIF